MVIRAGSLLDAISVTGSTVPEADVTITSEVPGKVTKILFREGSYVQKGAPLIQLDDEELQAQRERLKVQEELTEKIAERLKNLYDKEGVSLQEYEVAAAEAKQVTAEINLLDVQIAKRTVRAPFSGVLGLKQVSEGSYLSPGTPVVSLVSTNPIHIEFSVPEKYGNTLERGSKISFQIEGLQGAYPASVIAKEPNIEPTTRTMRLKASAPNPNGKILPGAFAAVSVNLRSFENAILVPTEAIVPELGGKKIFVYRDGKAEAVPVETGIRKDAMIQIIDGLEEGDTVITTGVLQIRDGAAVELSQLDRPGAG
jgi:membrane fusion protein (multidrug efflux system)